jgi:hypothetical protein
MSRIRVDLKKLPTWKQYVIAIVVVTIVVVTAWMVGRNRPVPTWLNHYLVPFAGWFGIFAIACLFFLRRR